jgi:hypothetical protein
MSAFKDPFSPEVTLGQGCEWGAVRQPAAHDADLAREPDPKRYKTYTCVGHCFPRRFWNRVTGESVNRPTTREYP